MSIKNKISQKGIVISELDNALLLLLKFAKTKGLDFLNEAQIYKIIYNLQIKSLEFVGEKFCDIRYFRQERGPVSLTVKRSLEKLADSKLIKRDDKDIGREKPAHLYSIIKDDFAGILDANKALFALSTYQLLEKKFPGFRNKTGIITLGSYETEPMKHITNMESSSGSKLHGTPINFDLVNLNSHIVDMLESE